jgi:uridine kinase
VSEAQPILIGVAGGSGSGKTAIADGILGAVGAHRIAHVPLDNYYRAILWNDPSEIQQHNFDHPAALDWELLEHHFAELRRGRAIELPIYDFGQHRRLAETQLCEPRPVVLTEGILLLAEPRIRDLLDFKIFVDTDADVRLARRIRRDLNERGRDLDDVLRQYLDTVRPMHLEFVEPSRRWADLIVPEGGENRPALDTVVARIEQLLA